MVIDSYGMHRFPCCCAGLYSGTCLCYYQEGHTALYKASYYGQRAVADVLVNAKAKVDAQSKVRMIYM